MDGLAWFIYRPKDMDELRGVHALDAEEPYRVAAEITLEPTVNVWMEIVDNEQIG